MSNTPDALSSLSPLKRALLALDDMKGRLDAAERAKSEPIAIVGMGCRFPGAEHPDAFWRLLNAGANAVREVPKDRWDIDDYFDPDPNAPGKIYTRWGAFIDRVDGFDPQFFGIAPREAHSIDPQQRLLLEVAWEALESAAVAPDRLSGTPTGVFVGICSSDYANLQLRSSNVEQIDAYAASGTAHSIAAGRLSYVLGLQGPSMAIDTACSSSLVAIHLACQSLRNSECSMALAAGVHLLLSPLNTITFCKLRMLAADGRCKAFDAAGDGFVEGEGCGVLVLKRLSDAVANGDNIRAVIRGSAINQDGASSGLTAPNGPSQEAVIRTALQRAGVRPGEVGYIEAHGTGTSLGDPIEVQALAAVLGPDRPSDRPLLIGSVKTNIGHTEAAAGVAGLIKLVLALQHEAIPQHLHFNNPNPFIAWPSLPIKVATERTAWPRSAERRVGGVSSFGFSGTNVHIVVEEAPLPPAPKVFVDRPLSILTLSARTEAALGELIGRWTGHLAAGAPATLADLAHTANAGRAHLPHRLALTAASVDQLRAQLEAAAAGQSVPGLSRGKIWSADTPRVAFLFTGQGAQHAGMGRELYETQPTFQRALERCAKLLDRELDRPLLSLLYPAGGVEPLLDQTGYAQPAMFAVEYALAELWKSWGVTPGAVLGHSVGEYVAACVAGVFSLEDAIKLIAARGRLMQSLPAGGAMAAVFAGESRVREAMARLARPVSIAAVNGPDSVVVSGGAAEVSALLASMQADGVESERLPVSHAFHSALMDPILDDFERIAANITYRAPRLTVISNVTGRPAHREIGTPGYWRTHVREAVRFGDGIGHLYGLGYRMFLEIGPKPTLCGLARRALPSDALLLPSLRKSGADWEQVLESTAALYVRGVDVDWTEFDRDYPRRKYSLPTYPFQRDRHWFAQPEPTAPAAVPRHVKGAGAHPLLGSRLSSALAEIQFETEISTQSPAFLDDHRKRGQALFPATAYLELGVAAARAALGPGDFVVEDLAITQPLLLDSDPITIQTVLARDETGGASFRLFSRAVVSGADEWRLHAAGAVRPANEGAERSADPLENARERCTDEIPVEAYYRRLLEDGHEYGPVFRGMSRLWRGSDEALASIELPQSAHADASAYRLHPALLDAALQLLGAGLPDSAQASARGETYLPISLGRFRVFAEGVRRAWSHVRVRPSSVASEFSADVHLYDDAGAPLAEILDICLRRASVDVLQRAGRADSPQMYEPVWRDLPTAAAMGDAPAHPPRGTWVVLGDDGDTCAQLSARLQERGAAVVLVNRAASYDAAAGRVLMDPGNPAHSVRMLTDARAAHGQAIAGLVHLWSLGGDRPGAPEAATRLACEGLLHLVQAIAADSDGPRPRLAVVTRGAVAVGGAAREITLGQAPVWGLARTIIAEHRELQCVCVDLDPQRSAGSGDEAAADAADIADALDRADAEHQVAYRDSRRYVARLVRSAASSGAPGSEPVALETGARGILDRLEVRPASRRPPGPGEIEVRVAAAGLNFRDVLNALGMYEGEPGPLGSECVGTVVTTAPDVTHVKIGDTVLGMAAGGLRTYVTAPAGAFIAKPERLSIDEAATVPVTFLTAEYALNRLAQMKPGQRVLIHAAAGGVGLAAVQLAQRAGAEIIATAGSPEKHDYLHSLGVEHVFSSRTLDFAAQIHALTGGEGVDIVLNSLAGDFIDRSVSTLRTGGCFLEIGKAGIWTHDQMAAVRPDVSYFPIYLGNVELEIVQQMLRELMDAFASNRLTPLPLRRFTLNEAADAFRYMAQAKHIGKIVISVEEGTAGPSVRDDASYLITGGLGALGLHLARHLVDRGARHLMLAGRSGPSPEAARAISELEAAGADVLTAQADVSREPDVARLLAAIDERMPPLAGIIHAAGVLDDGVLAEQTWPRFAKVLAPKLAGAWNLHRLTEGLPLDFFVMFSSMVSLLGGAGQGSYAAANAFLDALAHLRRARGLPALSINWGPWAGIGMAAAADERDHRRWREGGFGWIQPHEAMAMLEPLLKNQPAVAQLAVLPIDWATLLRPFPPGQEPRFFSELAASLSQVRRTAPSPATRRSLAQELESVAPGRRRALVEARLRAETVKVLGLAPEAQLDPRQPLREIGLDSLMAVELRNAVAEALGRTLPSTLLFKYPTLEALFEFVVAQLPAPAADAVSSHPPAAGEADLADVDALTDDEARALLSNELQSLAGAWQDGSLT